MRTVFGHTDFAMDAVREVRMLEVSQILSFGIILVLVGAALTDICARRVPNRLSAAVAVIGLCSRALGGGLAVSLLAAVAVFAVLYVFWLRGWLGGGDVKLLAACVVAVPVSAVGDLLLAVSLSGGLLALIYLALRPAIRRAGPAAGQPATSLRRILRIEGWRIRRGGSLPYACAIAAGCAFTIVTG